MVAQFLGGACYVALYVLCFLILEKYGTPFMRVRISPILAIFNTGLVAGLFSLLLKGWQYLVVFMVVANTLMLIPTYLVLREDPIYLFNCDRLNELKVILCEIATINGATPEQREEALNMVEGLQGQLELNI